MTLTTPEQFVATQRDNLDAFFGLVKEIVDGAEKWARLNVETTRSTLAETENNVLKALSAKEPSEWLAQQSAPAASVVERVQSYTRKVVEIVSGVEADLARLAQSQCEGYSKRIQPLVDDLAKNAPTGSEATIAAWKSAMEATNALVDSLRKGYEQAAQVAESNLAAAISAASKATGRSTE